MAEKPVTKLYTPTLLSLATQLAHFPLDKDFSHRAQARSRTCGSTIDVGVDLGGDGRVLRLGMQVSACAIGQSSAAILANGASGRSPEEIAAARDAIAAWLSAEDIDGCPLPEWPEFQALEAVREHKGRHGALLLAWKAVTQALSTGHSSR